MKNLQHGRYLGHDATENGDLSKVGVMVVNLGTPPAPSSVSLRGYLKQFLSDPRVVEVPRLIWFFVLRYILLRRPAQSARAYRSVWTDAGSPLAVYTQNQAAAIQAHFGGPDSDVVVEAAMRYGQPSVRSAWLKLRAKGASKLFVLPLYPQYCAATTGSTFDALSDVFQNVRALPELRFLTSYHAEPTYIECLAQSVRNHWEQHGKAQKLIVSFHGIPQKYADRGDPYRNECAATTRLLARALGLDSDAYQMTFQSRFGKDPWLTPYTDETLKSLPSQGIDSVQVICPGFAADCLETIEEIGVENRDYFLEAGGKNYEYILALNATPNHIAALTTVIEKNIQTWL